MVPLSAKLMAEMMAGLADNLLLFVIRAQDTTGELEGKDKKKVIIIAVAINTAMWRHPITQKQIKVLEEDWGTSGTTGGWNEVLEPTEKTLACGDTGNGAMQAWGDIVKPIEGRLQLNSVPSLEKPIMVRQYKERLQSVSLPGPVVKHVKDQSQPNMFPGPWKPSETLLAMRTNTGRRHW